jgi:hypothetical protein
MSSSRIVFAIPLIEHGNFCGEREPEGLDLAAEDLVQARHPISGHLEHLAELVAVGADDDDTHSTGCASAPGGIRAARTAGHPECHF